MNNELFDKILKSELDQVSVAPSAGLKKAVGAKLFMQNVVVFHKVKAIVTLFFVGGAVTAGVLYSDNGNDKTQLSQANEVIISTEDIVNSNNLISVAPAKNGTTSPIISFQPEIENNASESKLNGQLNSIDKSVSNPTNDKEGQNRNVNNKGTSNPININSSVDSGDLNPSKAKKDIVEKPVKSSAPVQLKANATATNDTELLVEQNVETETFQIERMQVATLLIPTTELAYDKLKTVDLPEIGKMPKVIVKEVSFDLYGLTKGTSDIDNSITSVVYNKYYWDFYKESEGLAMENGIGGQVNFTIGSPRVKFTSAIGLNTSKFIDTKAQYSHGEIKNRDWLDYFGTDELSWVNTYGEDTLAVVMYASNTDNFKNEMEEEYNRYSYINIPVKAGVEFDLKRFSVSAYGGVQLSQLIASKGLAVANRDFSENERFYYWNDLKVVTLQDDNQIMKNRFLSYQAGVDVRVRILPKFDLLAGFEMNASANTITKAGNIVQKSISYNQTKVGVTFHPSRSAVKPKF